MIPFGAGWVIADINVGVLYLFAISSLGVYGIIMAGWARNSKYPFLGALRSAAQMVSYEVSIGFVIIIVLLLAGSLNLVAHRARRRPDICGWFCMPLSRCLVIFFVSVLAETNRPPFDLPEAESELVAGYNVEYSSMTFVLFFLGEYANIILMSATARSCSWAAGCRRSTSRRSPGSRGRSGSSLKICFVLFVFIWARATLPRYRYDQLMRLGWKVFLPASLLWVVLTAGFLVAIGSCLR